jgi:hypothetical protein
MQGELDLIPWITGIASVQRTCWIDPKVLGFVALRGVAGASEKPGCWGVYATGGIGEAQPIKNLFYSRTSVVRLEWLIYEGSSLCWVGWVPCDLMSYAGGRVALGQFDPIQAPRPRRPWLSCVCESGSRCEDDLGVDRRGWEAGQAL